MASHQESLAAQALKKWSKNHKHQPWRSADDIIDGEDGSVFIYADESVMWVSAEGEADVVYEP